MIQEPELPTVFENGSLPKTVYKRSGNPVLLKTRREQGMLLMLLVATETKGRNWLPGRNENGWWFVFEEVA